MNDLSRGTLYRESCESFLLFAVTGLTLAGYLGLAFVFVGVFR